MARLIRTTYEIVTPESAEQGDADERGWIDEAGEDFDGEDYRETWDGEPQTPVDAAIEWLSDKLSKGDGGREPSSSSFHPGIWYTAYKTDYDYETGGEESRSYHLHGWTEDEERAIYQGVTGRRNPGRCGNPGTADDWNSGLQAGIKARQRGGSRDFYKAAWEEYRERLRGSGYSAADYDRARSNFIHAFILGFDNYKEGLPYPGAMPNPANFYEYERKFHVRGMRGPQSIFGTGGSAAMLDKLFPEHKGDKAWHADKARVWQSVQQGAVDQHHELFNREFEKLHGRPPGHGDFRISGVGDDKLPGDVKDRLRDLASVSSKAQRLALFHARKAGLKWTSSGHYTTPMKNPGDSESGTRVYFRREDDGGLLAVFPDLKELDGSVTVYSTIGQHSSADMGYINRKTRPVNDPAQYERLKRELEGQGYTDLRVIHRNPSSPGAGRDWEDWFFDQGKLWGSTGSWESGVSNANVRHYGFVKSWNELTPQTARQVRKSSMERAFNEGYKIGRGKPSWKQSNPWPAQIHRAFEVYNRSTGESAGRTFDTREEAQEWIDLQQGKTSLRLKYAIRRTDPSKAGRLAQNPTLPKGQVDKSLAVDIAEFALSNYSRRAQHIKAVQDVLDKYRKRGKYDPQKALKAYLYVVEGAWHEYRKEYPGYYPINHETKLYAAQRIQDAVEDYWTP